MKKLFILIMLVMLFVGACSSPPEVIVETVIVEVTSTTVPSTATLEPTATLVSPPTSAAMPTTEYVGWIGRIADRVVDYFNEYQRVNDYTMDDPTIVLTQRWKTDFYMVHLNMIILAKEVKEAGIVPPPAFVEAHGFVLSAVEHYGNAAQILYDINWFDVDNLDDTAYSMTLVIPELELGNAMIEQATKALPTE